MRESDTILKINLTLCNAKLNIALRSLNKISETQTTYNNLKHHITYIYSSGRMY